LVEISEESGVVPMAARMTEALELDPQQQTVHASVLLRVTITEPDISGKPE
jgi:hypothetical protein